MIKNTLALVFIPIAISIVILTTTFEVNYNVVLFIFVTALLIAIYEEILFRFIGLGSFINAGVTPFKAILLSSFIFSFSHIIFKSAFSFDSALMLLNSFAMGCILGYIYFRTKNILYVIGLHFVWDFAVLLNQKIASDNIGLSATLILLMLTVWYFIWSYKACKNLY